MKSESVRCSFYQQASVRLNSRTIDPASIRPAQFGNIRKLHVCTAVYTGASDESVQISGAGVAAPSGHQ